MKAASRNARGLLHFWERLGYFTYILQSDSSGRYYVGSTEDLERRVRQHNDPSYYGSKTTKRFKGPWRPQLLMLESRGFGRKSQICTGFLGRTP